MSQQRTKLMFVLPVSLRGGEQAFVRRATAFFGKEPLSQDPVKDYTAKRLKGTKGTYLVERKIGDGSVGAVYKGRRFEDGLAVGDEIAIKIGRKDPAITQRFRAEAFFLTQLSHPSILTCYDYFEDAEATFLVTELLKGAVLSDILKDMRIPIKDAVAMGILILEALEEIHSTGIVHRDLKPDNIFICEDGILKIIDFGVSRLEGGVGFTRTTMGVTMGTPEYMSPEQIASSNVDAKADLYSFGIILYELLTGTVPFKSDDPDEKTRSLMIRTQHIERTPAAVRTLNAAVSKELEAVALRLLSKDKTQRYDSATEVREDLERLRNAGSLESTTDTRPPGRRLLDRLLKR